MFKLRGGYMKQRGDTIIEVLLALTVVGLSLGIAYGITNRSLAIGRNAQERTEAVKLAESQIETLKDLYSGDRTQYEDPSSYCLIAGYKIPIPSLDPSALSCLSADEGSVHGFYDIELSYTEPDEVDPGDPAYFESIVQWVTPGSRIDPNTGESFKDEVILRYRP
jgi:type II secretory pathway pseudopilin PulG